MTETALQRVALAILRESERYNVTLLGDGRAVISDGDARVFSGSDDDCDQFVARSMAYAAIEAMREPTNAQIDAAIEGDPRWSINAIPRIRFAYRHMISAALSETEGG